MPFVEIQMPVIELTSDKSSGSVSGSDSWSHLWNNECGCRSWKSLNGNDGDTIPVIVLNYSTSRSNAMNCSWGSVDSIPPSTTNDRATCVSGWCSDKWWVRLNCCGRTTLRCAFAFCLKCKSPSGLLGNLPWNSTSSRSKSSFLSRSCWTKGYHNPDALSSNPQFVLHRL